MEILLLTIGKKYLETNDLQFIMKVIQDSPAIKDESWLQHFLVNAFIIQFLQMTPETVSVQRVSSPQSQHAIVLHFIYLKHIPFCADNKGMGSIAGFIGIFANGD